MTDTGAAVPGAVVIGASSGIGRVVAEELARQRYNLVVAARDQRDLAAVAADLTLRYGVQVTPLALDLSSPDLDPPALGKACTEILGRIDAVVLTAAVIDDADSGLGNAALIERLVAVNLLGAIKVLSGLGRIFEQQGRGTLVVFSSIAAAAPRRNNLVYAATKAGLETYCHGLRHHFACSSGGDRNRNRDRVVVQTYRLGYAETAMTYGRRLLFPVVSAQQVARQVVRHLGRDRGLVTYPRFWSLVLLVLRRLPWILYRRLDF